jgi:hypothetical protein
MAANNFYRCVNLLKERLENNPLINTVIFAKTNEKDLYKKQIFPIAHINPQSSPFINSQVNRFTFEIGAMEQRDLPVAKKDTKFEGDDNVIDNLNLTFSVLNDLVSWLQLKNNDDDIELIQVSEFQPLTFTDFNILDGWVVRLTLEIRNDEICFE